MATGLATRIGQLERAIGTDDAPRRILIWYGPYFTESWVERHGQQIDLHVRTPDDDASPWDHLTAEMQAMIRPGDSVASLHTFGDRRDPQLQLNRPPWQRRPWRWCGDDQRRWEWQDTAGCWRPGEELA